jgi:hypothetical protein
MSLVLISSGASITVAYTTDGRNIKIDLKEIVCKDVDWIHLAQNRVQ